MMTATTVVKMVAKTDLPSKVLVKEQRDVSVHRGARVKARQSKMMIIHESRMRCDRMSLS